MLGSEALPLDGHARRISGSASPNRFVAFSSSARLLRSLATSGWSCPKVCSSMASARSHQRLGLAQPVRGSAASCARLLRSVATLGWAGPRVCSSMASARRISGSASARRLCPEQLRQVVEGGNGRGVPDHKAARRWRARAVSAARPRRIVFWAFKYRRPSQLAREPCCRFVRWAADSEPGVAWLRQEHGGRAGRVSPNCGHPGGSPTKATSSQAQCCGAGVARSVSARQGCGG